MKDGIHINDLNIDGVHGFEIKIDPIAIHEGLKEQIDKAREEIPKIIKPRKPFSEFLKKFENRFCDVCFFGKPVGECNGERLCHLCFDNMYEYSVEEGCIFGIKRKKSYEWWVRDCRRRVNEALFAAYGELAEYKVKEEEDGKGRLHEQ